MLEKPGMAARPVRRLIDPRGANGEKMTTAADVSIQRWKNQAQARLATKATSKPPTANSGVSQPAAPAVPDQATRESDERDFRRRFSRE